MTKSIPFSVIYLVPRVCVQGRALLCLKMEPLVTFIQEITRPSREAPRVGLYYL